jgi:hypothetical protein
MTSLMNQQLSITKESLETVNSSISDMEYNNNVIKEGSKTNSVALSPRANYTD